MTSGYMPCACRDCMDIAVSSDMFKPELCAECAEAGCEIFPRGFDNSSAAWECRRDDAYDNSEDGCEPDCTVCSPYLDEED